MSNTSGIGGLALGLGLNGFRPVMEIQFFGFVYEVMDSVSGQMARMRYRSGGRWTSPVTIRSPFGGGVHTRLLCNKTFQAVSVKFRSMNTAAEWRTNCYR